MADQARMHYIMLYVVFRDGILYYLHNNFFLAKENALYISNY